MNRRKLKSITYLLIFLFGISSPGVAQNGYAKLVSASSSDIPKSLERKFKRDAARLALRIEAEREDLRYLNIDIPRDNIDGLYEILTGIYVQDETAKSIAKCNIHTFPNPSIDQFVLIFNREIDWAEPLREGITETNSDEINELLDDYELVIESHEKWTDEQDAIVIRSKEPLNMAALANEFYNIEGVEEIDLGIPEIEGSDIQVIREADGWEVQYILNYGAVGGNGKKHIWKYKAFDNGGVQFISEEGDPIPSWMRCDNLNDQLTAEG